MDEVASLKAYIDESGLICLEFRTVDGDVKIVKTNCKGIIDTFLTYEINGYFTDSDLSEIKEGIDEYFSGIL